MKPPSTHSKEYFELKGKNWGNISTEFEPKLEDCNPGV